MKKSPWLSHAGRQLREQIDDRYPNRDRRSDGWVADSKHSKKSKKSIDWEALKTKDPELYKEYMDFKKNKD